MSSPVVVRLAGGMGNQLFQFAAALSLANARALPSSCICFDDRFLSSYETKHKFEIGFISELFHSNNVECIDSMLIRLMSRFRLGRLLDCSIATFEFISSIQQLKAVSQYKGETSFCLLDGYFQHPDILFFEEHRSYIRDSLLAAKAQIIADVKQGEPSVAVHIRRGDYISSKSASQVFCSVPIEYYRTALDRLPPDRKIIVFSDDRSLSASFSQEIGGIDARILNLSLEDEFCLMMACDEYVIANSTFSWWAAYLGHRPGSRTFAPTDWYHDSMRSRNNPLLLPYFELIESV